MIDISQEGEVRCDVEALQADATAALAALDRADAELSVVCCDDAFIQPLNLQYRDLDEPTDVLSFPQDGSTRPHGRPPVLGDIVISVETAARQATALGHDVAAELRVLLVHGLCHLLGHDHHAPAETAAMRAEERRLLAILAGPAALGLIDRLPPTRES